MIKRIEFARLYIETFGELAPNDNGFICNKHHSACDDCSLWKTCIRQDITDMQLDATTLEILKYEYPECVI